MNRLRIPVMAAAALCLCAGGASAQSKKSTSITKDETVVIHRDKGDNKTVVEIKDGKVYVNGEAVVTITDGDGASVHKKVIIEDGGPGEARSFGFHDNGGGDRGDFKEFFDEGDNGAGAGRKRAMLGVMTDPKSAAEGAVVKNVQPGSAAEDAGLKEGDVITRVDGKRISDAQGLVTEIMTHHEPGDQVSINYERGGEQRTTKAKLGSAGPQVSMRRFNFGPEGGDSMQPGDMPNSFFRQFSFPGMEDEMTPAPKLGVSAEDRADGDGVRVLDVKPGTAAAAAGLKEGDVITRVAGEKIASVDELQRAVRESKAGQRLKVEFQRNGREMNAEVLIPKTLRKREL